MASYSKTSLLLLVVPLLAFAANTSACPSLARNLMRGASGSDVVALQTYLGVSPTGFFGTLTQQAVIQLQQKDGISPIGVVGPMTRAAIGRDCTASATSATTTDTSSVGISNSPPVPFQWPSFVQVLPTQTTSSSVGGSVSGTSGTAISPGSTSSSGTATICPVSGMQLQCPAGQSDQVDASCRHSCVDTAPIAQSSSATLAATPVSGTAPLSVAFVASVSDSYQYVIDYGDGSTSSSIQAHCLSNQPYPGYTGPAYTCNASANHTYSAAGTYTAILTHYIACLYSSPRCMMAAMPLATATIRIR